MAESVRVGIVGFGFMGRTHAGAYRWAADHAGLPVEITTVADGRGDAAFDATGGNLGDGNMPIQASDVRIVTDARELFASDDVDLISICTPTDTHVDLAIAALEAGKSVLVEKPVATTTVAVERLVTAAKAARSASGVICSPAMCMRFWPEWAWLRNTIDAGELGPVHSASFTRLGAAPAWSGFYADESVSGGAILDLHVHDVDFVLHCFGTPSSVTSQGTTSHVSTLYGIAGGPGHVLARGGWLRSPSFPFTMRYVVEFESAVADFDLGREQTLTLHESKGSRPIDVPAGSGYDHQAAAVARAVLDGGDAPVSLNDALASLRVIEAERASMSSGDRVRVRN
ncbi:MAG: Gfo/Idh/MocA family oxidoreductase [Planctomycetota bacterium]